MFTYNKKIGIKILDAESEKISSDIQKLQLPSGLSQFVLYSLSELHANIKEHSNAKNAHIRILLTNKDCSIEIHDDGIGLKQSYFNKNIFPKDDFSAIEFALSGLSTKYSNERGFGLYSLRKLTTALNGKMTIGTSKAMVIIQNGKLIFRSLVKNQKGVTITIKTKIKKLDFFRFIE